MTIIISFTTIPSRIDKIYLIIENLQKQTLLPDKIILNIPKKSIRFNTDYIIPESLLIFKEKISNFEIKFVDEDYGPATKLLPCLQEYTSNDDIIITIDDDVLLENHVIEELIEYHKKYPNNVLGFMGIIDGIFIHSEYLTLIGQNVAPINDIMGGYRSILYPRRVFDNDFFDHYKKILELHKAQQLPIIFSDDHLWSEYLKYKNVIELIIRTNYFNEYHPNKWNFIILNFKNGISDENNEEGKNAFISSLIIKDYFKSI